MIVVGAFLWRLIESQQKPMYRPLVLASSISSELQEQGHTSVCEQPASHWCFYIWSDVAPYTNRATCVPQLVSSNSNYSVVWNLWTIPYHWRLTNRWQEVPRCLSEHTIQKTSRPIHASNLECSRFRALQQLWNFETRVMQKSRTVVLRYCRPLFPPAIKTMINVINKIK